MEPVTVYPDAEKVAIDYLMPPLSAYDSSVPISVRGSGPRFVRVRRVGGTEESPAHDRPVLDVIVWHDSDKSRMALASQLWGWLRAAADTVGPAVLYYDATVLGPRQMPDPADDTKTVCMFTVQMLVRSA